MSFGKTLKVVLLLSTSEIKRFYGGWVERPVHREWPHLWRKELRIETCDGVFIVLNRLKSRLNFRILRELCLEFSPVHRARYDGLIIMPSFLLAFILIVNGFFNLICLT